jgi:hypothetical protein
LLVTTLCFWLRNAKAKGNAKAKDAKAKGNAKAKDEKAKGGATFAFDYATAKAKGGAKGNFYP